MANWLGINMAENYTSEIMAGSSFENQIWQYIFMPSHFCCDCFIGIVLFFRSIMAKILTDGLKLSFALMSK